MANEEQQGFGVVGARRRLEEWFLENLACPIELGIPGWLHGRRESIRVLLFEHWGQHLVASRFVPRGSRKERDFDLERGALGVALAILELDAYEATGAEAAIHCDVQPLSRAVARYGRARPRNLLADACAQQLRAGGFSYGDIAAFMDITEGAAKWHCKAPDVRSLLMCIAPEISVSGRVASRTAT